MVSTDTRDCVSYMGHRSVALTWSSVVDERPDRSSRTGRRHRRNVWCECSSKSTHCSKVHGSYHPRTIGLDSFTRRPVWTRRASHPAPLGRLPRGGAKVTWFRYSCEYGWFSGNNFRSAPFTCSKRRVAVSSDQPHEAAPRLGLVVRCGDLALSQKKHAFLCVFSRTAHSQNTKMTPFSLIAKVCGHV